LFNYWKGVKLAPTKTGRHDIIFSPCRFGELFSGRKENVGSAAVHRW